MSRLQTFTPGEYFHVYNRGTNKMNIFLDEYDYSRFQKLLFIANSNMTPKFSDLNPSSPYPVWTLERGETLVDIGSHCLMPNHFHLLIRSKNEKNTSLFIQRILLSYSKYFNKKNNRSGNLFQGKSKSEHILGDKYLKYIYTYQHLNPVKLIQSNWKVDGLKNIDSALNYLENYKYSSYVDYLRRDRPEVKILNKEVFPNYFGTPELFKREISDFLQYGKQ